MWKTVSSDNQAQLVRMAAKERMPEVGLRYESDQSRIRALYEIPLRSRPRRVLEIVASAAPTLPTTGWSSPIMVHDLAASINEAKAGDRADPQRLLPFTDGTIDLVVMHGTLDSIAGRLRGKVRRAYLSQLFSEVRRVLHPDGVVAGCATNRIAALLRPTERTPRLSGAAGISGYRRVLRHAGFDSVNLFAVYPGPQAPHDVLSVDPSAMREIGRIKLHAYRDSLSSFGYALRRVLVELSFDCWLAPSLFFYSAKR